MGKWEMVRLGVHVEQIRGVSYKPEDTSDVEDDKHLPLLRAHNIQSEGLNRNNLVFVSKSKIRDHQFIKSGDIVVCASSGSKDLVGKAAQATENMDAAFGAFCKVVRPKSKIDATYLKHYFSSPKYRHIISELSAGANINNLRNEHIDDLQIPLPPLEVQRKIADVLDRASALIEKRKAQIDKLDLLVKSQFIGMFGDPVTNPKGWEKQPMGNYLALLTDFSANGSYEYLDSNVIMYDEPNYALMIRTTDLERQDFTHDVKYINKEAYAVLGKSKLFGEEIIMNKIGSAGKVYLMPVLNIPASLGRNAFMFRYKESINPVYIFYFLTSNYGENEILKHVRGAVTKTITKDAVRSIPIIAPPICIQNEFAGFVHHVEAQKTLLQQSLAKIEQNYKSVMQKCFAGEVF